RSRPPTRSRDRSPLRSVPVGQESGSGQVPARRAPAAVSVRGLSHAFEDQDGNAAAALVDIDLEIAQGEFVAIVGPSGCGKTTLMNLVAGLEAPQTGQVEVAGHRPRAGDREVGYLFARDALLPWRTVLGNAELAMEIGGVDKSQRRDRAMSMLSDVGLSHAVHSYPAQLSQGMRQRVAIARTLATTPELLMLDEPFSALDAQTKLLLQDTFSRLWAQLSATVVLITHDLSEAIALADRVVLMTARPGRVKRVLRVDLPRPRSIMNLQGEAAYHKIYEQLWGELREEVS
ncbi:MAG: ABC transporter ATP-binding protein, partial [Acidimicrobiales bacterium]